jgi:hypothetical protein
MLFCGCVFTRSLRGVWVGRPHLSAPAESLTGDCAGSRQV